MSKEARLDPLYVIFEQNLCNFHDDSMDRKLFIDHVLQEYLSYLRKLNITVPKSLEQSIIEELADQVRSMLIKKTYGYLSIQEYQTKIKSVTKRRAKARYQSLERKIK